MPIIGPNESALSKQEVTYTPRTKPRHKFSFSPSEAAVSASLLQERLAALVRSRRPMDERVNSTRVVLPHGGVASYGHLKPKVHHLGQEWSHVWVCFGHFHGAQNVTVRDLTVDSLDPVKMSPQRYLRTIFSTHTHTYIHTYIHTHTQI